MLTKPSCRILVLIAALFLVACGPKHIVSISPVRIDPGDKLFSNAEKLFQAKSYDKALKTYNEYLSRFSDRSLAPAALMKIGAIYRVLGNNVKARNIYKRMIADYPDSLFAPEGKIEILATFYNEGRYNEVINRSVGILKDTVSRVHILRIYALLGDTYAAIGSPADAVYFYIMAHKQSKDPEKEIVIVKLRKAIKQLDSIAISSVLERLEDMVSMGFLMYQIGLTKAQEEEYDDAVLALSEFIEKYPENENTQHAKTMIEELYKKSVYSRYTIGCLLPLSGPYKIYGNRALKGIELALSQFSSQSINPCRKYVRSRVNSKSNGDLL